MSSTRASVFLTQTPFGDPPSATGGMAPRFRAQYEAGNRHPFALVDNPRDASLIVYCEDYQASEHPYAPKLRAESSVAEFPEKVFAISAEDRPIGFLPGIYVSMPRSRFDDRRFRSGAYFGDINPLIVKAEHERTATSPRWLFSFIGAPTDPMRIALLKMYRTTPKWFIQETGNAQYNIGVDDPAKKQGQQLYLQTLLESQFVLCPRGYGTSSFRLFETMRLGRVPVIISDEWVPPLGPAWSDFSIRIAERSIAELPHLLGPRASDAAEMGSLARQEWERWFSPAVYASRCLEWIHDLHLARTHDERAQHARWPEMIRDAEQRIHGGGRLKRLTRRLRSLRGAPPRA